MGYGSGGVDGGVDGGGGGGGGETTAMAAASAAATDARLVEAVGGASRGALGSSRGCSACCGQLWVVVAESSAAQAHMRQMRIIVGRWGRGSCAGGVAPLHLDAKLVERLAVARARENGQVDGIVDFDLRRADVGG